MLTHQAIVTQPVVSQTTSQNTQTAEEKKWFDFSNPNQIFTLEAVMRSCYANPERKKYSQMGVSSYDEEVHQLMDDEVTCNMMFEKIRDEWHYDTRADFDAKAIRLYDTDLLFDET